METLGFITTVYFCIVATRYLVISFSGFGWISLLPSKRKIQADRQATREQKIRELKHSLIASVPSSVIISFVVYMGYLGLNKVYFDISQYGGLWCFGQILFLMLLTDIWFYFVHRAMHSKKLFRHTPKLHHLSTAPTPFQTHSVHAL